MGFAASKDAFDVLDKFDGLCRSQTGTSNSYRVGDQEYFYEISRRDQPDNGICGSIHLCLPDNMARKVGTFKIDGDGKVVRGPAVLKQFENTRECGSIHVRRT